MEKSQLKEEEEKDLTQNSLVTYLLIAFSATLYTIISMLVKILDINPLLMEISRYSLTLIFSLLFMIYKNISWGSKGRLTNIYYSKPMCNINI